MAYNSTSKKKLKGNKKTANTKRTALKRIGLFVLGVVLVNIPNTIVPNWVNYLGFIVIFATVLFTWISLRDLLDIYFPIKKEIFKFKNTDGYSLTLVICSFVLSIVLWEEDTVSYQSLVWSSVTVGTILSIPILYMLNLFVKDIFASSGRRFAIISASLISFPLLMIGTISHLNVSLAENTVLCDNFTLTDKSITEHEDHDTYKFYFVVDEKETNYEVDNETWNKYNFGDHIEVCFIDGYFGFDKIAFIDKYDPQWDK
jgi:hypothetical protein